MSLILYQYKFFLGLNTHLVHIFVAFVQFDPCFGLVFDYVLFFVKF